MNRATSPNVLLAGAYVVMNGFSYLLNQQTLVVGFVTRYGQRGPRDADLPSVRDTASEFKDGGVRSSTELAEFRKVLQATKEALNKENHRAIGQTESQLSASIDVVREQLSGMQFDPVELEFRQYLVRSGVAASTAQRRPNALLFIGTIIAVLGLLFFILTLPGSRFGILPSEVQAAQASLPAEQSTSHDFLQLLPRLLMLVFIQLLAGFFLKQYRASMEDFRYYESILRHREAQYLSYVLRKKSEDKKSLVSFAKEIMEDRPLGMLAKGQTTTTLEAQRIERNEFASFYEMLAELAMVAKEKATGSHRRARSKKKPDEGSSAE
jgi:hypothetical protein